MDTHTHTHKLTHTLTHTHAQGQGSAQGTPLDEVWLKCDWTLVCILCRPTVQV